MTKNKNQKNAVRKYASKNNLTYTEAKKLLKQNSEIVRNNRVLNSDKKFVNFERTLEEIKTLPKGIILVVGLTRSGKSSFTHEILKQNLPIKTFNEILEESLPVEIFVENNELNLVNDISKLLKHFENNDNTESVIVELHSYPETFLKRLKTLFNENIESYNELMSKIKLVVFTEKDKNEDFISLKTSYKSDSLEKYKDLDNETVFKKYLKNINKKIIFCYDNNIFLKRFNKTLKEIGLEDSQVEFYKYITDFNKNGRSVKYSDKKFLILDNVSNINEVINSLFFYSKDINDFENKVSDVESFIFMTISDNDSGFEYIETSLTSTLKKSMINQNNWKLKNTLYSDLRSPDMDKIQRFSSEIINLPLGLNLIKDTKDSLFEPLNSTDPVDNSIVTWPHNSKLLFSFGARKSRKTILAYNLLKHVEKYKKYSEAIVFSNTDSILNNYKDNDSITLLDSEASLIEELDLIIKNSKKYKKYYNEKFFTSGSYKMKETKNTLVIIEDIDNFSKENKIVIENKLNDIFENISGANTNYQFYLSSNSEKSFDKFKAYIRYNSNNKIQSSNYRKLEFISEKKALLKLDGDFDVKPVRIFDK